jgi:rod shape-determining protein MreC
VAAFGTAAGRPLGRGGSAGLRFTFYAVLSVVAMYLDQRQHYLEQLRYVLQSAAYPIQLAVNSPTAAWHWLHETLETRATLEAENARLRGAQRELQLRAMRYEALERENGELRGLAAALPPVAERWLPAEIVNVQLSSLRQRLLLDRGALNGVFKGQAVLDEHGLIGQTTHVGAWSTEVILITDPEHAVPVRIERTGLRTIAVGAADTTSLALPYLPANADIRRGDLLVTSGLGGVFPEGYPVARVIEVHRDAVQPLAQVRAAPLAHVDTDTEVMLVWFRADHPAAPAAPAPATAGGALGELKQGNPAMQPQTVKPTAAAPAASAAPGGPAAAHTQTSAPTQTSTAKTPPAATPPPGETHSPGVTNSPGETPSASQTATPGETPAPDTPPANTAPAAQTPADTAPPPPKGEP